MGVVRKIVVGTLAIGAAKLAMRNKDVKDAAARLKKRAMRAAGMQAGRAAVRAVRSPKARRVARKAAAAGIKEAAA